MKRKLRKVVDLFLPVITATLHS